MKAWSCALVVAVVTMAVVSGCSVETETRSAMPDVHKEHSRHHESGSMSKADAAPVQIAQKTCPVMGGKIDEKIFVEHGGRRVYFCCGRCENAFQKDPAKYLAKLDAALAATHTD